MIWSVVRTGEIPRTLPEGRFRRENPKHTTSCACASQTAVGSTDTGRRRRRFRESSTPFCYPTAGKSYTSTVWQDRSPYVSVPIRKPFHLASGSFPGSCGRPCGGLLTGREGSRKLPRPAREANPGRRKNIWSARPRFGSTDTHIRPSVPATATRPPRVGRPCLLTQKKCKKIQISLLIESYCGCIKYWI